MRLNPMLHYLAQGAYMAIADGVSLANKMSEADGDFAAAFLVYQRARDLRTGRVQTMAHVYGEVYHASDVVSELRNAMLVDLSAQQAYESMAWLYDYEGA